jgi:hypothetical protein
MENLPLPPFSSSSSASFSNTNNSPLSTTGDNSPSSDSRRTDNNNWYDDGSIETCIHPNATLTPTRDIREIAHEDLLQRIDMNDVGDEFFLISPRHNIKDDDELSSSISDDKHEQELQQLVRSDRIYPREHPQETSLFTDDPFELKNSSTIMITDLDDILDDDHDASPSKDSDDYLLNTNYRRPIQEDILYEVEHENSFSDHSQNTSSVPVAENIVRIFCLSRDISKIDLISSTSTRCSADHLFT